jgi:hypothetical protein
MLFYQFFICHFRINEKLCKFSATFLIFNLIPGVSLVKNDNTGCVNDPQRLVVRRQRLLSESAVYLQYDNVGKSIGM